MLDPTSEAAYEFLEALLGEMGALFPERVLHLGDDEVQVGCLNASATVSGQGVPVASRDRGLERLSIILRFSLRIVKHVRDIY